MDLSWGSELEAFRQEVADFVSKHWPPSDPDAPQTRDEQRAEFRLAAIEHGYLYRNIPRRYGGSEQESDEGRAQILREEFRKARAPMEVRGIGTSMLVPTLLEQGTEWQKQNFVPKTILGEIAWCQGYSEPSSGSDLASLRTRGERVGDEWVINGQKIWTSSADEADYMFCLVRTEPDAQKHAGISYLLIDMHQPGIEVRPLRQMTGGADFCEVFFNDARTPADWIVGERGQGWQVSRTTLKHERNTIGGSAQTQMLLTGMIFLAKTSRLNGRPAIEDHGIRQRLAELEGYVLSHHYSGLRQFTKESAGDDPGIIRLMTKLMATNIGHQVARLAIDLLGDDALMAPGDRGLGARPVGNANWIEHYMYSLGIAVAGGTANIQRNVIAERGLGLPRDSAADRSASK